MPLHEVMKKAGRRKVGFLEEFKELAIKGNAMDMAVGIIIGAAFGKIVSSLVGDMIMPPIGIIIGGVDFPDLVITCKCRRAGRRALVRQVYSDDGGFHDHCLCDLPPGQGHQHREAVYAEERPCDDERGEAPFRNPRPPEREAVRKVFKAMPAQRAVKFLESR